MVPRLARIGRWRCSSGLARHNGPSPGSSTPRRAASADRTVGREACSPTVAEIDVAARRRLPLLLGAAVGRTRPTGALFAGPMPFPRSAVPGCDFRNIRHSLRRARGARSLTRRREAASGFARSRNDRRRPGGRAGDGPGGATGLRGEGGGRRLSGGEDAESFFFLFLDDDPWSDHHHQALRLAADADVFEQPVDVRDLVEDRRAELVAAFA